MSDHYYIYKADTYCQDCGDKIIAELTAQGKAPADPENESTYDSDNYPKIAPCDDAADSMHHCATCGQSLRNDLTIDGWFYEAEQAGIEIFRLAAGDFTGAEKDTWQYDLLHLADPEIIPGKETIAYRERAADLAGWYWWSCQPGCLPDGEASGPFNTALAAAQDAIEDMLYC